MSTKMRTRAVVLALAAGVVVTGVTAAPAQAKGGSDGRVEARGACQGGGTWKLKVKPDDGRLEVEFEVDTNRNGQTWAVKVNDNGHRVFTGNRTTAAPSGSFSVETRAKNLAGRDAFVAKATRGTRVCLGRVTL